MIIILSRRNRASVNSIAALVALMVAGSAAASDVAYSKPGPNEIYEYDLTGTLAIYAGEPEIAIDPQNPRHIAAIAYAHGAPQFPIYELGSSIEEYYRDIASPYGGQNGDIYISTDGGDSWTTLPRPNPVEKPPLSNTPLFRHSGGDPMIAFGPNGVLYVGEELDALWRERPGYPFDLPDAEPALAASKDLGKTWTVPHAMHTPVDRPWITVDQSTGKLYSVSSGELDLVNHTHNIPGPDVIVDRWLVAYQPMLAKQTAPRRLGGPDFAATVGNTIAAAHGVIAATFVIVPATPYSRPEPKVDARIYGNESRIVLNGRYIAPPATPVNIVGSTTTSNDVPISLRSVVPTTVTQCTNEQPCLFFETSQDDGQHWTRHYVPVPGSFSTARAAAQVNLAVDAGRPGRYAIGVLSPDQMHLLVVVSDDYGATWSAPAQIPEIATGIDFKQWMAYGPTGVIGFMWKKQRDDMPPPTQVVGHYFDWTDTPQSGFDVYDSVSCDGGLHWQKAVRVNAETSPGSNTARHDDVSYIVLDTQASHLVWGDRRVFPQIKDKMAPGAIAGTHAYYGRVPFSVLTDGEKCGR